MGQVEIKNAGNPVVIGGVIAAGYGKVTSVDEDAFADYCKGVAGSHVFANFLTVVDKDYEKKKRAESAAVAAKAVNEVKAKVLKEVEADLTVKIGKKYQAEIDGLNGKISDLNGQIETLTKENMTLKAGAVPPSEEEKVADGEFVLDPEKHHIEHRGAGKWFVMDQEEKVHGPLSEGDRAKYEEMLK